MVGNQSINQKNSIILFLFLGCISLLSLSLLNPILIRDKIDYQGLEVNSLRCTFDRRDFDIFTEVSKETGRILTVFNLTIGTEIITYYSEAINKTEVNDVGVLRTKDGTFLAISSDQLMEETNYIVERGKILYLNIYGHSDIRTFVQIEEIRQLNWFDSFSEKNSLVISIFVSLLIVITITFFSLPLVPLIIKNIEDWYIFNKVLKKEKNKPTKK